MNTTLLEIIKNVPFMIEIDEDDLIDAVNNVELKTFPRGTYVFREGDKGEFFYVIKSGKIEIFRKNGKNKDISIAILYPDNFFGEMALLSDKPRSASAKCIENSELFVFNKKDFLEFLYL